MVNSAGGVEYLLSDGYGSVPSVATGVGIALSNTTTGQRMPFVGWGGCTESTPCNQATARTAGWFPVLTGSTPIGSSSAGYTSHLIQLTATLSRLPGQQAQPGNVDAKAYVLIKVQ
ncbi:fimbrial protein [Morganella psychrotolerans]|uniref:fimbrial protein n=1 Tax=Morganella psychrotolerans TaxID=368603 RepID=UPI000A7A3ECD